MLRQRLQALEGWSDDEDENTPREPPPTGGARPFDSSMREPSPPAVARTGDVSMQASPQEDEQQEAGNSQPMVTSPPEGTAAEEQDARMKTASPPTESESDDEGKAKRARKRDEEQTEGEKQEVQQDAQEQSRLTPADTAREPERRQLSPERVEEGQEDENELAEAGATADPLRPGAILPPHSVLFCYPLLGRNTSRKFQMRRSCSNRFSFLNSNLRQCASSCQLSVGSMRLSRNSSSTGSRASASARLSMEKPPLQ
eukprot:1354609-Rhodomonas_salina.1